jgi:hypothetical protein
MNKQWWIAGVLGFSCGGLAIAACSSSSGSGESPLEEGGADSTTEGDAGSMTDAPAVVTPPVTDARVMDAPTTDAPSGDGAAPVDAGADASTCMAFDAGGLDEASVAAGFTQVWQVYRCYGCHQPASDMVSDAGAGIVLSGNNGGLGDSGTIFPPNLTSDPATGLGCWSDSQIANAILNGVDDEGRTLCKPMPKFSLPKPTADGGATPGYPMDAGTAQEIVDYLRSLPVVVNEVHDTTCPAPDSGTDAGAKDAAGE